MRLKATPLMTIGMLRALALFAIACALSTQVLAQQTAADTQIQNQASASYSDSGGGSYNTVSNTVIVLVAKVSGLTIIPDGATDPSVVPGQTGVLYSFRVNNTGNFADQVRFLSGGASVYLDPTSPATITRAVIDVDNSGTINAGDTDIKGNGADVLSSSIAQNGFITVLVEVSVNAAATSAQKVQVYLGDASTGGPSYDDQAADTSVHEVRTVSAASVNGLREARGDRQSPIDSDALLQLSLTAPTGPVPLGSVINYNWQLCNTGLRAASSTTLVNGPAGSNTGVFIVAPIPAGTQLDATQSFPAGVTVLYSTSPLSADPVTTATWVTTQPALSSITRVAFNIGSTLAAGACSPSITMNAKITTTDATNPIVEQGNAYAHNSLGAQITALSPQRTTTLLLDGKVLNGPQGKPDAVGPTDTNDDYTNKSVNTGIAGIPPCSGPPTPACSTNALGIVTFTNTLKNTGNANDTYTLTVPSYPAGSTIKVTVNGVQTTVVNGGVATGNAISPLSIAFGLTADYQVEVTLPAGKPVLAGYDTVIRATSGNTNTFSNNTIDRVFTGFVQLTKSATVANATGKGGPTDAVPGAVITFSITYKNVTVASGTGNVDLKATSVVITEDGTTGTPNNWATYTDHVVGATDTLGGTITGDTAGSTLLRDTIALLNPNQSGVFSFKRQIK